MSMRWKWTGFLPAWMVLSLVGATLWGQAPYPGPAPSPGPYPPVAPQPYLVPPGAAPAAPAMVPWAAGAPVQPAMYAPAPIPAAEGTVAGGPGWCPACGGIGCPYCMGDPSADFDLQGFWRRFLPYAPGGACTQRWFDLSAEFVNLKREDVSRTVNFTSDGILGPIVLSSSDLEFNEGHGFRASAALQLRAGLSLEGSYLGTFNWDTAASVTSPDDNLFSAFSDFGFNPFNGFDDTDGAAFHSIAYSSAIDTVEMNLRRRWVGPNCRLQGSTMVGVRYFQMEEEFLHVTDSPARNGHMDYFVAADNYMTGFQIGGDLWATVVPGVLVGGELKAGLFGNRVRQATTITANSIAEPVQEQVEARTVGFVGEANVAFIWRINQNWTARAGYEFLFVDGVALAIENFNDGPPFVAGQRTPFLNHNGNVFYHGFTVGLEWLW